MSLFFSLSPEADKIAERLQALSAPRPPEKPDYDSLRHMHKALRRVAAPFLYKKGELSQLARVFGASQEVIDTQPTPSLMKFLTGMTGTPIKTYTAIPTCARAHQHLCQKASVLRTRLVPVSIEILIPEARDLAQTTYDFKRKPQDPITILALNPGQTETDAALLTRLVTHAKLIHGRQVTIITDSNVAQLAVERIGLTVGNKIRVEGLPGVFAMTNLFSPS